MDKDFPADKKSLFKNPSKVPDFSKDIKQIKWYRPHEIIKDAKFLIDY
ncbi:MAG: C2 family cysteine protease [bacterium]